MTAADFTLRRAEPADAEALSLVASATFLQAFAGLLEGGDILAHCRANNGLAAWAGWLADPVKVTVLAEHAVGGAPIGYTLLTPPDLGFPAQPGDIELKRIYTLAATHGSGLGTAMMTRAVADARAAGATRMLLGVYPDNHRARRFYEREGFVVIGERRFQVGATVHRDPVYARSL